MYLQRFQWLSHLLSPLQTVALLMGAVSRPHLGFSLQFPHAGEAGCLSLCLLPTWCRLSWMGVFIPIFNVLCCLSFLIDL